MKKHSVTTTLSTELIREFEKFYNQTSESNVGRRLRDMLIEYSKSVSAKEDLWANRAISEMGDVLELMDCCEDEFRGVLKERIEMERKLFELD